ncbi:hypothetical protein RJ640_018487 [Escallonia rubra]|uniref:RING-type E3 ubiquitin transferase n=1 Tax=Escallonia rubra TaxID=112253 RepID=A0AA88QRL4_9ASTE|nr:hypothetical protein RJ640_018487 [Escallonia rubra]
MAFSHRKLMVDPPDINISELCSPYGRYCNPDKNTDGRCPLTCLSLCYPTCNIPFFLSLTPPPPDDPPSKSPKLSLAFTVSLAILVTAFFIFCCFTIYKFYTVYYRSRQRRSSQPEPEETHDEFLDEDHGPMVDHHIWYIRTVGLQPSTINAITICKYKRGEGLVEGTECSVCLSEFQDDETLRLLPKCNHAFHVPCIDTWLRSHTNCPLCRAGIVRSTAPSPPPEQSATTSVLVEETQVRILENDVELRTERGDEEEGESPVGNRNYKEGFQPIRRSVSLDCISASIISADVANANSVRFDGNLDSKSVKLDEAETGVVSRSVNVNQSLLRLMGSSSIGRSLPNGSSSIKRSFSCSGKVFLSRYSRSRTSVFPS